MQNSIAIQYIHAHVSPVVPLLVHPLLAVGRAAHARYLMVVIFNVELVVVGQLFESTE